MNKKTFIILILICLLSLFLNLYKRDQSPLCLNADEAAFGYNAYSILKTGKDEYGNLLPLRLKSFGDYKMPFYSYLSIPFIKFFGLTETSTRSLNTVTAFFLPLAVFYLAKELLNNKNMALVAALLTSTSLGLHIVGRQAHEAYLAVLLLTLSSLFFLKILKKISLKDSLLFYFSILLSLFSYQSARIVAFFFFIYSLYYFRLKKKSRLFIVGFALVLFIFTLTDFIYKPERVKNLLFFNNPGFTMKIFEMRAEGANRYLFNKLTIGAKDVLFEHLKYYSPQFLVTRGDENSRFGFSDLSPITIVEYIFIFIGLYYLFRYKQKWGYFLILLLLIAPLSSSLTWAGLSITRSLFIFIPISIVVSYGFFSFLKDVRQKYSFPFLGLIVLSFLVFLFYSWNFYLNHYPKRGLTIYSQQCGYKQLGEYIKANYNKFNRFYISPEHGEPYIFLLFYLNYPPDKYQKQAHLSAPDKYGFGQVDKFDKFIFTLTDSAYQKDSSLIAYPHDFIGPKEYIQSIKPKFKKIKVGKEEIFWIYEKSLNEKVDAE